MKKRIPIVLLEIMEKLFDKYGNIFQIAESKNVLKICETDPGSPYHFTVEKIEVDKQKGIKYISHFTPCYVDQLASVRFQLTVKEIESKIFTWAELVVRANKVIESIEDPILFSYEEDLSERFQMMDEDAETAPFDLERQLWLDDHLDHVIKVIESKKTEDNSEEADIIIFETKALRKELPKSTKSAVMQKLRRVWARSWKFSLEAAKEIFIEVAGEVAKKLLMP